jgi:hypothetical protein
VFQGGRRPGFEIKCSDAPRPTKSMAIAQQDLRLDRLFIVYPGETSYPVRPGLDVVAIGDLDARLESLVRPRVRRSDRRD